MKLLSVFITLCMVLLSVPSTVFAQGNQSTPVFYTKVETTAQVKVKNVSGDIVETKEVKKFGDFILGDVDDEAIQNEIKRIDDEIKLLYKDKGTLTEESRNTKLVFDHSESDDILKPLSDESGSVNPNPSIKMYQIYQITYDLVVQETTPDQVITMIDVININKDLDASKPVSFTAEVNPNSECKDQMDITEEWWIAQQIQVGDPYVGRITKSNPIKPTAGQTYNYNITFSAKDGYIFHAGIKHGHFCTVKCNGVETSAFRASLSDDQKELTLYFEDIEVTATSDSTQQETLIQQANIEKAKLNYQVGESPKVSAEVADEETDQYEIAYECWEEMENGEPVAFWYSDESKYIPSMKRITKFEEGKDYMYSIELREKDGYKFSEHCDVRVNSIPQTTIIKTVNGLFMPSIDTIHPVTLKEIGTIEINNATLNFKDGEKVVFTGTTPEDAKYMLVFEEWRTDGEWTRSEEWFNNDEHHGNDKIINTFEKNKTYHYNIFVQPTHEAGREGWVFGPNTKLIINGKEVSYTYQTDAEYEGGLTYDFYSYTELSMTPETTHTHSFKWVIDKEPTTTTKGSKHEECTICGYKKESVEIPMKDIETKPDGSTTTEDKKADKVVQDTIQTPQTGDHTNISLGLSVLLLSMLGIIVLYKKKYIE